MVLHPSVPASDLNAFVAYAKARPGQLTYATSGPGGTGHMATELFSRQVGVKMLHVPYKGIGPAFTDLMGGVLQMSLPTLASATAFIHSGKMRGLAVTGPQRSPLAPELPTASEAGLPGFIDCTHPASANQLQHFKLGK